MVESGDLDHASGRHGFISSSAMLCVCLRQVTSKPQFTHLENRNKNSIYVLVRIQSKSQKPLYLFQVQRALLNRIRNFHSRRKGWQSNNWRNHAEERGYIRDDSRHFFWAAPADLLRLQEWSRWLSGSLSIQGTSNLMSVYVLACNYFWGIMASPSSPISRLQGGFLSTVSNQEPSGKRHSGKRRSQLLFDAKVLTTGGSDAGQAIDSPAWPAAGASPEIKWNNSDKFLVMCAHPTVNAQ